MGDTPAAPNTAIHRCRFVKWTPSAVQALAFDADAQRLCVARGNGDLEVWSVARKWLCVARLPGSSDLGPAEAVLFSTSSKAVLTAGLAGQVQLHDLRSSLTVVASTDSLGGPVWALCALVGEHAGQFAVGCEDGSVRVFTDDMSLDYVRTLASSASKRVVSLAVNNSGEILASGSIDASIRLWSLSTGRMVQRISVENFAGNPATRVWSLAFPDNQTIVSGDSKGNTQFWDVGTGTLLCGFQEHEADVLTVCASTDGKSAFAAGVDNKVAMFRRLGGQQKWVFHSKRRPHTHDVLASALAGRFMVTGGVDSQLCVYDPFRFDITHPVKLSGFPHARVVDMAEKSKPRRLLVRHATTLDVWQIDSEHKLPPQHQAISDRVPLQPVHLLELRPRIVTNLVCSAISPDGQRVAYADAESPVAVLDLRGKPTRVEIPPSVRAARCVGFATTERLVVATRDSHLLVVDETDVVGELEAPPEAGYGDLDAPPVTHLAVCERWAAVGNTEGRIQVYDLRTMAHHGTLPPLGGGAVQTVLKFDPAGDSLVVGMRPGAFSIFEVETLSLTDWSREHGDRLPAKFTKQQECILGISFRPGASSTMLLQMQNFLCVVDLCRPVDDPANFEIVKKYHPILLTEYLEADSLVVVERPWIQVLAEFPRVLERSRFGA